MSGTSVVKQRHGLLNDEELMRRVQSGNAAAFDELVRRYRSKVYGLSYKILRHEEDAEDAAQDAFLSIWRARMTFRYESTFSTWCYRVTANAAIIRLRKRRPDTISIEVASGKDGGVDSQPWFVSGDPTPEEALQRKEVGRLIVRAIGRVPNDLQTVFILRHIDGMTNADVAGAFGVSVAAVKSRLKRACSTMRQDLRRSLNGSRNWAATAMPEVWFIAVARKPFRASCRRANRK